MSSLWTAAPTIGVSSLALAAPGPLQLARQGLEEMLHQGTGGEDEIDMIGRDIAGEFGVHRGAVVAKFEHIAEDRDAAAALRAREDPPLTQAPRASTPGWHYSFRRSAYRSRPLRIIAVSRPAPAAAPRTQGCRRRRQDRHQRLSPRAARRASSSRSGAPACQAG